MMKTTREEWMHAVLSLQRGRMCWCDHAIGSPMQTDHSPRCANIRSMFMGPSKGGDEREVAPSNAVPRVERTLRTQP
jgi:hypothetical protein